MEKELEKEARVLMVRRVRILPDALLKRVSAETRQALAGGASHEELQLYVIYFEGEGEFIFVESLPKLRAWIIRGDKSIRVYKIFFINMIKKAISNAFGGDECKNETAS